jgi:hypothetical protein
VVLYPGEWAYFAMDALPYRRHLLKAFWDLTGTRCHRDRGITMLEDGKWVAARKDLGPLKYELEQQN